MIFVITGNGKGKTTSAMGMAVRALGRGLKCSVFQFIKEKAEDTGEASVLIENGVSWQNFGCGFLWQRDNMEKSFSLCREGWEKFKEDALSGKTQLIILDEFTYVIENKFVDVTEVIDFFSGNRGKPEFPHIVITGRCADKRLIEVADTVSEIRDVKHHENPVCGIEF